MSKVAPNMTQERFNQIDTNKDGVLTMEDRAKGGKEGVLGCPGLCGHERLLGHDVRVSPEG